MGLLGLGVLCLKKWKSSYVRVVLYLTAGMIFLRTVYGIVSGRYASCLIYIFSILAAYFLACLIRFKNKLCTVCVVILGMICISNWLYKNYSCTQIDSDLEIVSQLHEHFNRKADQWTLVMYSEDLYRIRQLGNKSNPIGRYAENKTVQDLYDFIAKYKTISRKALFTIKTNAGEAFLDDAAADPSKHRRVLSVFFQRNRKKRIHVYTVEAKGELLTLSQNRPVEPESGILRNGDLEQLDSPEQSYNKLKGHIGRYSEYFDFDETKRTPVNAYFHNDGAFTANLPYYSCLNEKAISGKNSARIIMRNGVGYLLFYQRFPAGTYHYSVTVSGEKGTRICVLYDMCANKKWKVNPLVNFDIPYKGIFQIKSTFTVSDLSSDDFFLVGAWVRGDAYLDNFCLTKADGKTAP